MFKDVEADTAHLVDVRMINLGAEERLGRDQGVVGRQEDFHIELATFIYGANGSLNAGEEVSWVGLIDCDLNSWGRGSQK